MEKVRSRSVWKYDCTSGLVPSIIYEECSGFKRNNCLAAHQAGKYKNENNSASEGFTIAPIHDNNVQHIENFYFFEFLSFIVIEKLNKKYV